MLKHLIIPPLLFISIQGAALAMEIKSSAFHDKGEIPAKFTCEGDNISPSLSWNNVPDEAKSLVLIVDDPDAPDPKAPKMTWVHWVLYNMDPKSLGLAENISDNQLPKGTLQGVTSWKNKKYGGPCPPIGRHRYFHKLYALDTTLELKDPTSEDVQAAMKGHIIGEAQLMGTYQKAR